MDLIGFCFRRLPSWDRTGTGTGTDKQRECCPRYGTDTGLKKFSATSTGAVTGVKVCGGTCTGTGIEGTGTSRYGLN